MSEVKVTEGVESTQHGGKQPDEAAVWKGDVAPFLALSLLSYVTLGLSPYHSGSQCPYLKNEKVKLRTLLVLILKF